MLNQFNPGTAKLLPAFAVLIAGGIWGLFWLPMRTFDSARLPADWLTLFFFAVPAFVLLPVVVWRRRLPPNMVVAVLITGVFTGAGSVVYAVALVLTTVVKAILLFYLTPVWSTLFGCLLLGEKLLLGRVIALVLGLTGLFVILETDGVPIPSNLGDWMALLSGVAWAYGTVRLHAQQTVPMHESLFAYFAGSVLIAAVVVALPLNAFAPVPEVQEVARLLPWIIIISICFILLAVCLVYWGTLRLSPARAGLLLMSEVVVGVVSAALLTDEPFGTREIFGSMLIMSAALVEVLQRE